jgi:hypothetical protein
MAAPDGALVGPGEELDPLHQVRVTRHRSMIVPVGSHEIGQHLCITSVGLGARDRMAVPVTRHRHGVDGIDVVAGAEQRSHEQTPVDLDADDHALFVISTHRCHQRMELAHSRDRVWHPTFGEHLPVLGHHADVVMVLSPVHSHKEHLTSSRLRRARGVRSALMD